MEIRTLSTFALAAGSTSALALMASTVSATAEGMYLGAAAGIVAGDHPSPGYSDDDYQLSGMVTSGFVGADRAINDTMFAGVELAWTGAFEGDDDELSSYEYAYDINYVVDAKVRVGTMLGDVKVYGFGGVSVGTSNGCCYGSDYRFQGLNIGAGAEMDIAGNMFVGAEIINRQLTGTQDDEDGYRSNHTAASLRVGFKF